ncbi:MAG: hypothetical protein A2484_10270, partial [Nitrospirae bacterium RIFOXYC2_FULL_44_7]
LGTKIGGRIAVLNVKEGAKVKKRQLLATFDNYEQARSDYESALDLYEQGAASRQQYEAAKTIFEASRIVAPNDGLVAKVNYWEGETVVPGSAAITVVNYDKSWVEAQIDEIDIAGVKIGDKVKVTSDVYPDKTFAGEIYWIAPLAELRKVGGRVKLDEESYVFPCKIKFLGDHNELKINMSVNVDVTTKVSRDTLVMPREAMFSKDDSQTVFIVNGNRVKQRLIQPGIRSFTSIEVISGLNEGEKVALNNQAKLKDNGRVKIEQ